MKKKIVKLLLLAAVIGTLGVLPVCASESAKAEVTAVGAPANISIASASSEQWVRDSAGLMMKSTLGDNTVLVNCVTYLTTAPDSLVGDYTFSIQSIVKTMNVKTYGMNKFTGEWVELTNVVGAGTLSVTMDASLYTDIAVIVVK